MPNRLFLFVLILVLLACNREVTNITGWEYNGPTGGFQKVPYMEQESAPGMVLIEGGSYYVPDFGNNDTLVISSFYISKYEETNGQYLEYLSFLKKYYSHVTYQNALPDTTVWNRMDTIESVKNHFIDNYLRHSSYKDYPVVGVSPKQIERYAIWKTDRINEMILVREGILEKGRLIEDSSDVFSTKTYFDEEYMVDTNLNDLSPSNVDRKIMDGRKIRMEDGILLPRLRLPTEEEWQYAHLGIGDSNYCYCKTPKAGIIKLDGFRYLNPVKPPSGKSTPLSKNLKGLREVYYPEGNVYKLSGLNCNVAECIGDSLSSGVIGGSFLEAKPDNKAIYDKGIVSGTKYRFRQPFQQVIKLVDDSTGLYGFRLAMDRIGAVRYGYKPKRRYRYTPKLN